MNRKISIAIGTAAAVAFTGAAMASDLVTINSSEGYTAAGSEAFMPNFLRADCGEQNGTNVYGSITGSCPEHGQVMVESAAGVGGLNFWTDGDAVPVHSNTEASGYEMLNGIGDAFDNGLFRTDGTSYFSGLSLGWNTIGDPLNNGPDLPMGAPTTSGANEREQWIDQTVIGYVETKLDTNSNQGDGGEGPTTLAQNFRTSLTFTGGTTDITLASNHIDQRLEQMVELTLGSNNVTPGNLFDDPADTGTVGDPGNKNEFEASRQTLQMAFALDAGSNPAGDGGAGLGSGTTTDPDQNNEAHGPEQQGQLVSQDIEGFFFSCMNCDTAQLELAGTAHAFTPIGIDAHFMPYVAGWQTVPTVVHAP
jgi:hypothetical protein